MPLSQALIDAVPDYSWSDIAKMCKAAMIALTVSEKTMMMGHTIERANADSLLKLYEKATEIAATESAADTGGGNVLVIRGSRV